MALVVEDGTGLTTSEAYISVVDADTYFTDRGGDADWTAATTAEKEQALRKATEYMTALYRESWQGYRNDADQALDWPRSDVYLDGYAVPTDEVPVEVQRANAELAAKSLSTELLPDVDKTSLPVTKEKVGSLEVAYSDKTGTALGREVFSHVEAILSPLLDFGIGAFRQIKVSRG